MDFCKYVNVFQGTGEIDLPEPQGLASKWFFIKAQCGNTSPAAVSPFGAMSISPYSGGYPTGYGDHKVNTHAHVCHFDEGKYLKGFTHLQQSGTGAIRFYYNFLLVTPRYDEKRDRFVYSDEIAEPGYYSCLFNNSIKCELTADAKGGVHRYTFDKDNGYLTLDFEQQGLCIPNTTAEQQPRAEVLSINFQNSIITAEIKTEGISIFFAVDTNDNYFLLDGNTVRIYTKKNNVEIKVAVSLADENTAIKNLPYGNFDEVRESSYNKWNEALSHFAIESDNEEILEIFYSNLYHSLVKPSDFNGESFAYKKGKPFTTDLATLWDMYKTQLPLILMSYRDMGNKICETLLSIGETLNEIPNSLGLSKRYAEHSGQARMLGDYILLTAYRYGIIKDVKRMLNVITTDIFADNKRDFTVDGKCGSNTWMLDMADGCALTAQVAKENGDFETAEKLLPLAAQWKSAFDDTTGLLSADSSYYEGSLYNYSFRQMVSMDERIELAGGKEKFVMLLDDFFGYGKPDVKQVEDPADGKSMNAGISLGRFEGFNNESDTEAPYSYIYADRHDRTCEVISDGLKYMFTTGRGGLPGNNDTGALSSYYCLAALGIFPVAGQDKFLLGSPIVKKATITLYNGNVLTINVDNPQLIYVRKVSLNGKESEDFAIKASELLKGGKLTFEKVAEL